MQPAPLLQIVAPQPCHHHRHHRVEAIGLRCCPHHSCRQGRKHLSALFHWHHMLSAGLRGLRRPGCRQRCARTWAAAGGTNGSHPQPQQPVLDELVLALMQRRAQQGQPPLAQAPPVPLATGSQPAAVEPPQPQQEDVSADLSSGAAELVASVEAAPTSIAVSGPAPAAALAMAAYDDALSQRPLASVRFSLRLHAQPGQRVRVVGSGDELGECCRGCLSCDASLLPQLLLLLLLLRVLFPLAGSAAGSAPAPRPSAAAAAASVACITRVASTVDPLCSCSWAALLVAQAAVSNRAPSACHPFN